jgi:hypothetical protein
MSRARNTAGNNEPNSSITFETVREIALTLPGVEEGTSYGTPACKVRGKLLVREHQSLDAFVIRIDIADREILMLEDPETFFITDHYLNYPAMLVRYSTVRRDQLRDLLMQVWRREAPKSLVAAFHGFE